MDVRNNKIILPNIDITQNDNEINITSFSRHLNSEDGKYYLKEHSCTYKDLTLSKAVSKFLFLVYAGNLFMPIEINFSNKELFDLSFVLDDNQESEHERMWWDEFSDPMFSRNHSFTHHPKGGISKELSNRLDYLTKNKNLEYFSLLHYKKCN